MTRLSAVNMEEREALKREIEVLQGNVLIGFVRNPESYILVPVSFSYFTNVLFYTSPDSFVQARGGLVRLNNDSTDRTVQPQHNLERYGFTTVILVVVFFVIYF